MGMLLQIIFERVNNRLRNILIPRARYPHHQFRFGKIMQFLTGPGLPIQDRVQTTGAGWLNRIWRLPRQKHSGVDPGSRGFVSSPVIARSP